MDYQRNLFARPMNPLQRQWYRILLARKVGRNLSIKSSAIPRDRTYEAVCRERYQRTFHQYNQQFCKEVEQLVLMQPNAIDAMRIHRSFARATLWLPFYSKREINSTLRQLESQVFNDKDRERLRYIQKYGPDLKHF